MNSDEISSWIYESDKRNRTMSKERHSVIEIDNEHWILDSKTGDKHWNFFYDKQDAIEECNELNAAKYLDLTLKLRGESSIAKIDNLLNEFVKPFETVAALRLEEIMQLQKLLAEETKGKPRIAGDLEDWT